MNIDQAFPSKYLKAADIGTKSYRLKITSIQLEDMGDGKQKLVAYLAGAQRGFVVGRTNAESIAIVHGRETNGWIGKTIELFTMQVQGPNGLVAGIRVRGITAQSDPAPVMPTGSQLTPGVRPAAALYDPAYAPSGAPRVFAGVPDLPPANPGDFDETVDLDDSIPF